MPPIHFLNPPPNPFWDFVAGLEDHPFFDGQARGRFSQQQGPPSPPSGPAPATTSASTQSTSAAQPEISEKTRGKQATVEDPPEVDPSNVKPPSSESEQNMDAKNMPYRGRGRFAHAFDGGNGEAPRKAEQNNDAKEMPYRGRGRFAHALEGEEGEQRRGRGRPCRSGRGRAGWSGPPPFMFGHPFFARPPWAQEGLAPPSGREHRGPPGPPPHHAHGPPPHAHGPHGHHGPPGPPRRSSPPLGPRPGFDLGGFLNKLGGRLGVDLSEAAEGLGLTADRFTAGRSSQDVNFEPRADIFENKDLYTIHLSLPGAKKSDIGVDYDGEHSILRITGVVHRPDVDEQMLKELVVDGRKRESGVFEKAIRLGTKRDPASIDVAAINAKMTDGVLIVKIPKVEKVHQKREVPITADPVAEGQADYEDEYSEKPVLFDAEEQASAAGMRPAEALKREDIDLIDMKDHGAQSGVKGAEASPEVTKPQPKHEEAEQEHKKPEHNVQEDQLPVYAAEADEEEEDWEKFSDASGEGEYIKINVN